MPTKLLLVEDDAALAGLIADYLRQNGFLVDIEPRGDLAAATIHATPPDLVILDLMLPGMDGFAVCRSVRERYTGAILMLTARDDPIDQILGLELGADDYLPKPFELAELEARARALIRRSHGQESNVHHCGPLSYDSAGRQFTLAGERLQLTPREHAVLEVLILRDGKAVSKDTLSEKIFGLDESSSADAIEIYIHRLRKKLGHAPVAIVTLRGLGYLLEAK